MELDKNKYIQDCVSEMGYRVAYIEHSFGNRKTIIVAVENIDYSPMKIGEIEKLHRFLVTKLYVDNIVDENTSVEVGSPGLDRLLVSAEDFTRFNSSKIKISLKREIDNRKKFQAFIRNVDGNKISLELIDKNKTAIEIAIDDINQANLIPEINFAKK